MNVVRRSATALSCPSRSIVSGGSWLGQGTEHHQPALRNPTGATPSPQAARRVLGIATAHGMTVVEDDIFADFEPAPSARLAVLDGLDRVVRIDSSEVAQRAMEEKFVPAPGNVFSVSRSAASFMRFNVAQMADRRICSVLRRAMERPR
jgi:DNA-binding transcriptional MocR family regulator